MEKVKLLDLMETENDVFIDDEVTAGDGKKHSLSPDSAGSSAPQEKIGRRNSTDRPTVKGTSEAENPLTPNPPPPKGPPPPPPAPERISPSSIPPAPERKSPPSILRPIRPGLEVEIYDQENGNMKGRIISCQVKKGHVDYQKYKDHWNVRIVKGNRIYKDGEKKGFDLSNTNSYKILNMQQPSTLESREKDLKKS